MIFWYAWISFVGLVHCVHLYQQCIHLAKLPWEGFVEVENFPWFPQLWGMWGLSVVLESCLSLECFSCNWISVDANLDGLFSWLTSNLAFLLSIPTARTIWCPMLYPACRCHLPGMFNGKPWAGNSREFLISREMGGKSLSLGNSRVKGISRGSGNSHVTGNSYVLKVITFSSGVQIAI